MRILHTKTMIGSKKNYRRRGVALVEMALVLPIFLVLSLLLIQYGIYMNTATSLTNLSREGARYAAVQPLVDQDIKDHMEEACPDSLNWDHIEDNIVILPAEGSSYRKVGTRKLITVQINYSMSNKLFLPAQLRFPFMSQPIVLFNGIYTTKTAMMVE